MYKYNMPTNNQNMYYNNQDDRIIPGAFALPFLLGGAAGYALRPPYPYYRPYPYYMPYPYYRPYPYYGPY